MTPRLLTPDEIEYILSGIPAVPSPVKEISEFYRDELVRWKRKKLETILLEPAGIEEMKTLITKHFYNSLIQPKEPVGLNAGASIGSNLTQTTLNTFHVAGSNQTHASGVESLRQLANNTKKRKIERTVIHFQNYNMTRHEVFEMCNKFIGVKINTLLDPFKGFGIIQKPNDWWYDLFDNTVSQLAVISKSRDCMRFNFSAYQLYKYRITLADIADVLREEMVAIVCVWSPSSEGVLDVYIDETILRLDVNKKKKGETSVETVSTDDLIMYYRQRKILPSLSLRANIRGIEDLEYIAVLEKSVLTYIINSKKLSINDDKSVDWRIWIDTIETLVFGIPKEKYLAFFDALKPHGVELLKTVEEPGELHFDIRLGKEAEGKQPVAYFKTVIANVDAELDKQRENQRHKGDFNLSAVDPVYRTSKYIYAEANTREYIKILGYPEVNSERTICWNANVVQQTLGIHAASNVIAREFYDTITANEGYLSPQHLYLIARAMTYTGDIVSITSRGATKQNRGALADASFELPIDAFVSSATFGKKEKLNATSARIFVGSQCRLGTGGVKVDIDIRKLNLLIEKSKRDEKNDIDLSFFERDDLQIINREDFATNDVRDSTDTHVMQADEPIEDYLKDIPDLDIDSSMQISADWLKRALTNRPRSERSELSEPSMRGEPSMRAEPSTRQRSMTRRRGEASLRGQSGRRRPSTRPRSTSRDHATSRKRSSTRDNKEIGDLVEELLGGAFD